MTPGRGCRPRKEPRSLVPMTRPTGVHRFASPDVAETLARLGRSWYGSGGVVVLGRVNGEPALLRRRQGSTGHVHRVRLRRLCEVEAVAVVVGIRIRRRQWWQREEVLDERQHADVRR